MESLCPTRSRAASKGLLMISKTRHTAARTLIWLAALAIPVQGLPASSCGCTGGKACCREVGQRPGCCCAAERVREARCCCARRETEAGQSCCGKAQSGPDSGCRCGTHCRCGKTSQPTPATPTPVEHDSMEKLVSHAASTVSVDSVDQHLVMPRRNEGARESGAFTAQDRCIRLCRLTR